ncbi:MAG: aminoacyl-histidine dipeptidase [Bacteroidetes bacterium]|nr:aminoacyl-histidine dipeptidase [Bacteroidota bacterium]
MGKVLGTLKPELVWKHFEELCNCPRPSKKEEKAVEYVVAFAKSKNLETIKDKFGNVIVKKPASPGKENLKTVVLQGHLDIVCEKNRDVEHDFDNQGVKPFIDGDWVKAKGTTLGADNGIGVAAALAVLEDSSLNHGPIECLFTLDEETGLTGASNLEPGLLKADILINMDSEELGAFFIGCSGGKNTQPKFTFNKEEVPADSAYFEIKVAGLQGGHSGLEIHTGRGNALKIITRLLRKASKNFNLRLNKIEGGNKHNAIPREAFAIVSVENKNKDQFLKYIDEFNSIVKAENATVEPNLKVSAEVVSKPEFVMDSKTQMNLLNALHAVPHGVIKMSPDIPGLVETSTNLAVTLTENNEVRIVTSQRSSIQTEIDDIADVVVSVFELAGAEIKMGDGYPGWKPNVNSDILKIFKSSYKELYGSDAEIKAIHAGLECGILGEKYPGLDMISFGPTMNDVHSPDEKLKISTVEPFYTLLKKVLENIPAK